MPGVVRSPSRRAERVREAIPDSREGSAVPKSGLEGTGGPPGVTGGVERPFQRTGGSEGPPGG